MGRLSDWILESAAGEPVEAVVIGEFGGWRDAPVVAPIGMVLSWDDALPFISYEFDSGYGSPGCHAITAWTAEKIISVYQYDGATGPFVMMRNPVDHLPEMPGGG